MRQPEPDQLERFSALRGYVLNSSNFLGTHLSELFYFLPLTVCVCGQNCMYLIGKFCVCVSCLLIEWYVAPRPKINKNALVRSPGPPRALFERWVWVWRVTSWMGRALCRNAESKRLAECVLGSLKLDRFICNILHNTYISNSNNKFIIYIIFLMLYLLAM